MVQFVRYEFEAREKRNEMYKFYRDTLPNVCVIGANQYYEIVLIRRQACIRWKPLVDSRGPAVRMYFRFSSSPACLPVARLPAFYFPVVFRSSFTVRPANAIQISSTRTGPGRSDPLLVTATVVFRVGHDDERMYTTSGLGLKVRLHTHISTSVR